MSSSTSGLTPVPSKPVPPTSACYTNICFTKIRFGAICTSLASFLLCSCTYMPPDKVYRPSQRKPPVVIRRGEPQTMPRRTIPTPSPVIELEREELQQEELQREELEYAQPAPPSRTQSAENRLYAQAEQYANNAEFDKAAVAIERALRINPYSPQGYLRLAELHSRNREWKDAEQLALKAINYSHYHPKYQRKALKLAAWQLILEARQAQGNVAGAREAQRKIDELNSHFG